MVPQFTSLTHWGWVMKIRVSKFTIIVSDNGLSPGRRQAITWTNSGILLIRTRGANFNDILSKTFSFKKMHLKMSSEKGPFDLGLDVLIHRQRHKMPTMLQTAVVNSFSWMRILVFWFPNDLTNNVLTLRQVMAWRTGNKPLSNRMMIQSTGAFTPHQPVSSKVLWCEENLYFERWNSRTHPPI